MKKKVSAIIISFLILFIGGYAGYANYTEQKNDQEARKAINQLFQDQQHTILAEHVDSARLKAEQTKINKLKDGNWKKELTKELQKATHLLKEEGLAKKSTAALLKNGILRDQVSVTQIDKAQQAVALLTNKSLRTALQKTIDEAKKQFAMQTNAEKAVASLFSDHTYEKLAEKTDRTAFQNASHLVETIGNAAKKNSLKELLVKADGLLTTAEKNQAAAAALAKDKEKAAAQAVEAAGVQTASEKNVPSPTSHSSSNSAPAVQPGGLAQIVASSKTAQHTDQIVTVVASGASGTVTLLEKTAGVWGEVLKTNGMVGSQGVGRASEQSTHTPKGAYSLGFAFGKSNPGTQLPFRQITANSYWISDVNSNLYNTWQEGSFAGNQNEHLADYENSQYEYAIVINYNTSAVKGAGSAFFLHVSNGRPTAGCVSVPRSTMVELMKRIHPGAFIIMVASQPEIANY